MSVEKGVKREAVVNYTVSKWEKLKRDRTGKENTWNECIDAVMGNIQADSDVVEFRSQRPVPMAWQAVTNVESLLGVGLFPNDRFCMAVGENPNAEATADKRTRYMQNRLERMRYVEKYTGGHLKQLLTIGNSGRLLRWTRRQSRRKVSSYEFMGQAMGGERAAQAIYQKPEYDFDGPDFDVLDMFNFVFDPTATDMESTVKIYRVKVSPADLLADADEGLYDKKAVKAALEGSAPHEPSDSDAHARLDTFGVSGTDKKADGDDEVELLWCHGDCPVGGKKHEVWRDYIWVIANRSHLIRFEENPLDCGLSPLRHTALVPVIGSSLGVGIIEPVLGLIDLINVSTNQAIDAGAIDLNGMWAYREGAVNPDDLVSKPGGAVPCEDPVTDIKPLGPSMDFLQLYQTVEVHKKEFVDSTFSWKNAGAQDDQTATAAAISANLQGSVIRRLASRLENIDIEPDLKLFDEMEQQFYEPNAAPPLARYNQDGQQQYEEITPDIIYQDYSWKCGGSGEIQMRQLQQQNHFQWGIAVAQTPAMGSVNWEEWAKEGLRLMGNRAIDRLMPGLEKMGMRNAVAGNLQETIAGGAAIPPGSRNPEGAGPNGRGAIPNAGGGVNALQAIGGAGRLGG